MNFLISLQETFNQHPFIVALTANSLKKEKERIKKAGLDDFMIKPLSEEAFEKIMLKYLQNSSDETEDDGQKNNPKGVHFNQSLFAQKMGDDQDPEALKKALHQMKGMALNMHFERLHKLTLELEEEMEKKPSLVENKELYEKIQSEISLLKGMKVLNSE